MFENNKPAQIESYNVICRVNLNLRHIEDYIRIVWNRNKVKQAPLLPLVEKSDQPASQLNVVN